MLLRVLAATALALLLAAPAAALDLVETTTLEGKGLPPVAERLPQTPLVVDLEAEGRKVGHHGGAIQTLIGRAKDARLINVWGYARLVGYNSKFELKPDILEAVDVEGDSTFTLHLRKGHRWSDGEPFTAEDIRYWWEDVANDPDLSPSGPEPFMLVNGEKPQFEVLDAETVRFTWKSPNPLFLPSLAAAADPFIYRPAHYLRQFHQKFGDQAKIEELVKEKQVRNWAQLHNQMDEMYNATNSDLPSLQPWVPSKGASDRRLVMRRNPYFHRVDTAGHQLPYADEVVMTVADGKLIAAKAQAGEVDLQARGLGFSDITVLKQGQENAKYHTLLWPSAKANQIALYPNLTVADPTWRQVLRDARFRRALSLGIDRDMVNRILFFGFGVPSNNAVLKQSALFKDEYQTKWATYDPDQANALLDEMGLTQRRSDGVRLLPDGRPLEIIVETSGESQEETDALQLIAETWKGIGVTMFEKASDRDNIRNRALGGDLVMTVFTGYDNGVATADMSPAERVPSDSAFLTGMAWGAYNDSKGKNGEKIDFEPAQRLMDAYAKWLGASAEADRMAAWQEILDTHVDEVLTIGLLAEVRQPIVVKDKLQNVPKDGVWGWDPGANFGIYGMDTFFFDDTGAGRS
jgi:peptide/nickel transport system substrate-binding protein